MNFLEKLDLLMKTHNLNKHSLSTQCGIPYTTIDAFYKKGFENAKISTMRKLACFFRTSLDYLLCDDISDFAYGTHGVPQVQFEDELQHTIKFRGLNELGKQKLEQQLDDLLLIPKYTAPKISKSEGVEPEVTILGGINSYSEKEFLKLPKDQQMEIVSRELDDVAKRGATQVSTPISSEKTRKMA